MSADRSVNLSNKSPASSTCSLINEEPLPHFQSVEPPTFALSATLEEASQQHPPVSPGTATCIFHNVWHDYPPNNQPLSAQEAEVLLLKNNNLGTTVCTTAYGLISTIHHRTAQF